MPARPAANQPQSTTRPSRHGGAGGDGNGEGIRTTDRARAAPDSGGPIDERSDPAEVLENPLNRGLFFGKLDDRCPLPAAQREIAVLLNDPFIDIVRSTNTWLCHFQCIFCAALELVVRRIDATNFLVSN